jgi:hypothetical protein
MPSDSSVYLIIPTTQFANSLINIVADGILVSVFYTIARPSDAG